MDKVKELREVLSQIKALEAKKEVLYNELMALGEDIIYSYDGTCYAKKINVKETKMDYTRPAYSFVRIYNC